MSASINFTCLYDGTPVAVGTNSGRTGLPNSDNPGLEDVMIFNPGPYTVYVRAGDGTVVATQNSMPCPPGVATTYSRGSATFLALISPTAAQNVVVYMGNGQ